MRAFPWGAARGECEKIYTFSLFILLNHALSHLCGRRVKNALFVFLQPAPLEPSRAAKRGGGHQQALVRQLRTVSVICAAVKGFRM